MSVVDIGTRKPVVGEPPKGPNLTGALKKLIESIEDGTLKVEGFYLIVDCGTGAHSFDTGLTVSEALTMLMREQFRILCMSEGVKL